MSNGFCHMEDAIRNLSNASCYMETAVRKMSNGFRHMETAIRKMSNASCNTANAIRKITNAHLLFLRVSLCDLRVLCVSIQIPLFLRVSISSITDHL
jgi:hypothetical protein